MNQKMNTETPRTDAVFWKFHTHDDMVNLCRELEQELAHSLSNQLKTQTEKSISSPLRGKSDFVSLPS